MNKTLIATAVVSVFALTGCQTTGKVQEFGNSVKSSAKNLQNKISKKSDKAESQVTEKAEKLEKKVEKVEKSAHEQVQKYEHKHDHAKGGYHQKGGGLVHKDGHKAHDKDHAHDKKDGNNPHQGFNPHHTHLYMCNMGATVKAVYNPHDETAKLTVYAPVWKLNNQEITMALSPSASGDLYVNDKNPATTYKWHTKGEVGILSVVAGGKTSDIKCEGDAMPANHPAYKK